VLATPPECQGHQPDHFEWYGVFYQHQHVYSIQLDCQRRFSGGKSPKPKWSNGSQFYQCAGLWPAGFIARDDSECRNRIGRGAVQLHTVAELPQSVLERSDIPPCGKSGNDGQISNQTCRPGGIGHLQFVGRKSPRAGEWDSSGGKLRGALERRQRAGASRQQRGLHVSLEIRRDDAYEEDGSFAIKPNYFHKHCISWNPEKQKRTQRRKNAKLPQSFSLAFLCATQAGVALAASRLCVNFFA